jgi:hypothetical protein
MKTQTNFLFGLIAGATVGAALGLLLAPEKGSVNQQKVKEGLARLLNNLSLLLLSEDPNQILIKQKTIPWPT